MISKRPQAQFFPKRLLDALFLVPTSNFPREWNFHWHAKIPPRENFLPIKNPWSRLYQEFEIWTLKSKHWRFEICNKDLRLGFAHRWLQKSTDWWSVACIASTMWAQNSKSKWMSFQLDADGVPEKIFSGLVQSTTDRCYIYTILPVYCSAVISTVWGQCSASLVYCDCQSMWPT